MELVQWIVPLDTGALALGWAPSSVERLPASARWPRAVRRRAGPVASSWLPCPLVIGVMEGGASGAAASSGRAIEPRALRLRLGVALDGEAQAQPLPPGADDVRFAGMFHELVQVVADLCAASGVPVEALVPDAERSGLELHLAVNGSIAPTQLGDAAVLVRVGVELCLQARGLQLTRAELRLDDTDACAPVDGSIVDWLNRTPRPDAGGRGLSPGTAERG